MNEQDVDDVKPSHRLLVLGIDGAGKTSVLYRLKLGEVVSTIPTIGFNVEILAPIDSDRDLTLWDVGGQPTARPFWKHYFDETNAII